MANQARYAEKQVLLDAVQATAVGKTIDVSDSRHIGVAISTTGNANATIQLFGSMDKDVDFSSASTVGNVYEAIDSYRLDSKVQSLYNGTDGISFSGTDGTILLQVSSDSLAAFTAKVSAYADGAVTVEAFTVTNQ